VLIGGIAALLVLGAGAVFGPRLMARFTGSRPPEPAKGPVTPAAKAPAPKTAAPAPATAKSVPAPATTAPAPATPSDTLNQLAHAPVNAVNKAKGVIDARNASGQSRAGVAEAGDDLASKPAATPATVATKSAPPQLTTRPGGGTTSVAPGITATTPDEATAEASPAFRAFVSNAKITGSVGARDGKASMAIINGKLARAGEMVENNLGITFEGVDTEKKQITFKDKSGALVARRY
jgi:hypothetical protein